MVGPLGSKAKSIDVSGVALSFVVFGASAYDAEWKNSVKLDWVAICSCSRATPALNTSSGDFFCDIMA